MVQVAQHLDRLGQDLVGFTAFDVHHKTHAAGVVLTGRVIQALLTWGALSRGAFYRGQGLPTTVRVVHKHKSRCRSWGPREATPMGDSLRCGGFTGKA